MDIQAVSFLKNHYRKCCNKYYCKYRSILVHFFLVGQNYRVLWVKGDVIYTINFNSYSPKSL